MSTDSSTILEALRALPREERMRLLDLAARELAEDDVEPSGDPNALLGMMADEPELMDRVCKAAMQARSTSRMRSLDG